MQVKRWFWGSIGIILIFMIAIPIVAVYFPEYALGLIGAAMLVAFFSTSGLDVSIRSDEKERLWKNCLKIERIRNRPRFK